VDVITFPRDYCMTMEAQRPPHADLVLWMCCCAAEIPALRLDARSSVWPPRVAVTRVVVSLIFFIKHLSRIRMRLVRLSIAASAHIEQVPLLLIISIIIINV